MIKKLRQSRKNKKGFTLVELIVVIVIILVLAAVLVPSVLRYVEKARQASCKADAAATLVELQATLADAYAEGGTIVYPTEVLGKNLTVMDNEEDWTAGTSAVGNKKDGAYYVVKIDVKDSSGKVTAAMGDLTQFIYTDNTYTTFWTEADGWVEPYKVP